MLLIHCQTPNFQFRILAVENMSGQPSVQPLQSLPPTYSREQPTGRGRFPTARCKLDSATLLADHPDSQGVGIPYPWPPLRFLLLIPSKDSLRKIKSVLLVFNLISLTLPFE